MPFEQTKRHILRGLLLCYRKVDFDRRGTAGQRLACQVAQVFDRGYEFSAALGSDQVLSQVIPQVRLIVRKLGPARAAIGIQQVGVQGGKSRTDLVLQVSPYHIMQTEGALERVKP